MSVLNEQTTSPVSPSPQPPTPPVRRAGVELLELVLRQNDQQTAAEATRDLVGFELERARLSHDRLLAESFYDAGIFNDLRGKDPQQGIATALTKIQIGRGWNMNAGDAMQFVYFNRNGTPEVRNEYVAARLRRAGWTWKIQWLTEDGGRVAGCVLWPSFNGEPVLDWEDKPASVGFTKADAQTAKLLDPSKDTPWKTYEKDMYYWKAIARLKRQYAPDVLTGAALEGEYADALADQDHMPDTGPYRAGTREAAQYVANQKLGKLTGRRRRDPEAPPPPQTDSAATESNGGGFFE